MSNFQTQVYEQLDKLDDYLANRNQSERLVFGVVAGIVLAAIVYLATYDISASFRGNAQGGYNNINGKVNTELEYIDSMDNGGFLNLEQQTRRAQDEITQNQALLTHLHDLRNDVYAHSKDWFLTFDDASKAAIAMGLTVNGTDVKMSDTATLGGMKHSSFVLFGFGGFSSILRYVDWLETYGKFISIDSIIIESKDNRLNFSVAIRNFKGEV